MAACVGFAPAVVPANELGLSAYTGDKPNLHEKNKERKTVFVDAYSAIGMRQRLGISLANNQLIHFTNIIL